MAWILVMFLLYVIGALGYAPCCMVIVPLYAIGVIGGYAPCWIRLHTRSILLVDSACASDNAKLP